MTLTTQNTSIDSPKKTIPLELVIYYLEKENLTVPQIARRLNLQPSSIHKKLKRHNYRPGYLKTLGNVEIPMLQQVRHKLLSELALSDYKKTSDAQKATIWAILTDKQRLLEDKPTQLIGYADLIKAKEIEENRIKAFEDKYGLLDADDTINKGTTN